MARKRHRVVYRLNKDIFLDLDKSRSVYYNGTDWQMSKVNLNHFVEDAFLIPVSKLRIKDSKGRQASSFEEQMSGRKTELKLDIALLDSENFFTASDPVIGCLVLDFEDDLSNYLKYEEKLIAQEIEISQLKEKMENIKQILKNKKDVISPPCPTTRTSNSAITSLVYVTSTMTNSIFENPESFPKISSDSPSSTSATSVMANPTNVIIDESYEILNTPLYAATFVREKWPFIVGIIGFITIIISIALLFHRRKSKNSYRPGTKA